MMENSEECQFSLDELMDQIVGKQPQTQTVKNSLFGKYGEDILSWDILQTHDCFQITGYKSSPYMRVDFRMFKLKD